VSLRPSARSRAKQKARRAAEEAGRSVWKMERTGTCAICGRRGRVLRHHIVYEQHVRREGGDPWDLANALDVGARCLCHAKHHSGAERISLQLIPEVAMAFAVDLMGEDRAVDYFRRYYTAGEGSTDATDR
jgi:hypothetical protein